MTIQNFKFLNATKQECKPDLHVFSPEPQHAINFTWSVISRRRNPFDILINLVPGSRSIELKLRGFQLSQGQNFKAYLFKRRSYPKNWMKGENTVRFGPQRLSNELLSKPSSSNMNQSRSTLPNMAVTGYKAMLHANFDLFSSPHRKKVNFTV